MCSVLCVSSAFWKSMCCGVVPILFGWFLSVHPYVRLFSFGKLFCDFNILHPKIQLKGTVYITHRPEEALNIQSELIFINCMPMNETLVYQQLSLHQLYHCHPSQRLLKPYVTSHVQYKP